MDQTTILIVDDSAANGEVYTALLEHLGYRVLYASNGPDALHTACAERPALILMDVSMPEMDGIEATERLKSDPTTAGIPVIGVTAHDDAETVRRALAAGMEAYLTKPSPPRRVVEEVESWVGRVRDSAPERSADRGTLRARDGRRQSQSRTTTHRR